MVTPQATRRVAVTGAVAAVTVVGTYYGAQLKAQQELIQEKKRILEATPEERIAQLETARQELVRTRDSHQRKLNEVMGRRALEEAAKKQQEEK